MLYFLKMFRRPRVVDKVTIRVSICVEPDEGGYHAFNPAFKGLHVDGQTEEEAVQNFVSALPAYIESIVKHGEPLPVGVVAVEPHRHDEAQVLPSAFMRQVTMSWPTLQTSGIN
jgi:predicted RNase H-like HicB family nuclease